MKVFFVTGLFRSGTTFLARALNSHPNLILASDPFFEFYKMLRNKYYSKIEVDYNVAQPLSDYFTEDTEVMRSFHNNLMQLELTELEVKSLKEKIVHASRAYSPLIANHIETLGPGTGGDVLGQLLEIVRKSYYKEEATWIGTKEVWTDEFMQSLQSIGQKCINIIRDPRAIIASNRKSATGAYPVLFMIRQWRKSVAFSILNEGDTNFLRIKYEDLIRNPESEFQKICEHLAIPFSENLMDPTTYVDGAGEPWKQNSSHGTSRIINAAFLDKWKEVLSANEVRIIEWLCGPEMDYLGYEREQRTIPTTALAEFTDEYPNIAEWIKPYNFYLNKTEIEKESHRESLLSSHSVDTQKGEIEKYFIDQEVYNTLN